MDGDLFNAVGSIDPAHVESKHELVRGTEHHLPVHVFPLDLVNATLRECPHSW